MHPLAHTHIRTYAQTNPCYQKPHSNGMHVVLDSSYAVDSPWPLLSMKEAQREDVVVSRELEPLKNKLMFRHIIMLS